MRLYMIFLFIMMPLSVLAQFKKGPYIQELSANSVRILWETQSANRGSVTYGLKGSPDRSVEESSSNTFHNVFITGLLADMEYEYLVEGDSKRGYFRTFPITIKPVKFIVYGDNRTNLNDHQKVVNAIIKENPMFIINTGDLVESGISADDYQKFFEIERELLRNICIFPAVGNHEAIDPTLTLYKKYFFPPQKYSQKKEWYSFDFANIHISIFNTYDGLFTFSNEQLKWIESDLKAASDNPSIDHIFTVMHHGPYSASNHGDNSAAKSKVVPLLRKYGVDMTLAGHDHNYERGEAEGLRYMVAGGGGAPLYSSGTSKYTIYSESVLHYVVFNVYGPDVSGCAYRVDGTVMDCFTWTKRNPLTDAGYEDISVGDSISVDVRDISESADTNSVNDIIDLITDYYEEADVFIQDTCCSGNDVKDENIQDIGEVLIDTGIDSSEVNIVSDIVISKPDSQSETITDSSGCNCYIIE